MSDFTYEAPDAEQYHAGVLAVLTKENNYYLHDLLKDGKCSIQSSNTFSHRRWNGHSTVINFEIPMQKYDSLDTLVFDNRCLVRVCNQVMPAEVGFDIVRVTYSPLLGTVDTPSTLENDLEEISGALLEEEAQFKLPQDIMHKGQQMVEVYLYLYVVENYLRIFVDTIRGQNQGDFKMPKSITKAITVRKEAENRNQWIRVRGDSELFYLDFTDLGKLILNNWEFFKFYFPDQAWISSKIDELGNCRNLVAHNSLLGEHERDVIKGAF
jgi:hypothetical protein